MDKTTWLESTKPVFTPGGDPLWVCPVCGNGEHVYGIETADEPQHLCKDCGAHLKYPWEE